jgi:hypothetical protein
VRAVKQRARDGTALSRHFTASSFHQAKTPPAFVKSITLITTKCLSVVVVTLLVPTGEVSVVAVVVRIF